MNKSGQVWRRVRDGENPGRIEQSERVAVPMKSGRIRRNGLATSRWINRDRSPTEALAKGGDLSGRKVQSLAVVANNF